MQPWILGRNEGKKGGYYQYRYSLTDNGKEFLDQCEVDMPDLKVLTQQMNEQSSRFLELVSTILYFDDLPKDEVKEKVFTIKSKQRYTDEEFEDALAYIDQLKELN